MPSNYTDTNVNQMIFNVLDSAQYKSLLQNSQVNNNELYLITDDEKQITFTKDGTTIATYYPSVDQNVTVDLTSAKKDDANNVIADHYLSDISFSANASNVVLTETTGRGANSTSNLPKATTGLYGVTKLSSTASSTEQGLAATPKLVYDSIAQVSANLASVFTFKGNKASTSQLPSSGNSVGDVWHVTATNGEYVWTSDSRWELLGLSYDLSGYVTTGSSTSSNTTGITIADHATSSIYGVKSNTTAVRGVSGSTSVIGVKDTTTTASKVTLGDAFTFKPITSVGAASTWEFANVTVPIRADSATTVPKAATSATTVPIKNTSATTIPVVKEEGIAPSWEFEDVSVATVGTTYTVPIKNVNATSVPNITSLGTASTWTFEDKTVATLPSGSSSVVVPQKNENPTSVPNITSLGTASTWTFEDKTVATLPSGSSSVVVPQKNADPTSIPNVTSVGTASTWTFEDIARVAVMPSGTTSIAVPQKNATATSIPNITNVADVTVPVAATSATACDDITAWSAGSGSASLTFSMDSTDTKKLNISFAHTHTAPNLSYTARSITGVSGSTTASKVTKGSDISIYGVGSATTTLSSTTVSSKKSGANSTTPTLGTAISIYGVSSTTKTLGSTTVSSKKSGANSTIPTLGTAESIYGVSSTTKTLGSTTVSSKKSGANSTIPTLGTAESIYGVQGTTNSITSVGSATTVSHVTGGDNGTATEFDDPISIYGVQGTTTSVTGVNGSVSIYGVKSGTNSTTTASKASGANSVAPVFGTQISIPNVTAATNVTVPIKADGATTIPVASEDVTAVPIIADGATTVVTGKTHSITDGGHSHTV